MFFHLRITFFTSIVTLDGDRQYAGCERFFTSLFFCFVQKNVTQTPDSFELFCDLYSECSGFCFFCLLQAFFGSFFDVFFHPFSFIRFRIQTAGFV